jgi:hypothetical protein
VAFILVKAVDQLPEILAVIVLESQADFENASCLQAPSHIVDVAALLGVADIGCLEMRDQERSFSPLCA